MKKLTIAFNCNDNWIKYTSVTIASILENRNKKVFYAFHILTDYVSEENKAILEAYISHYKNTSVDFVIIEGGLDERITQYVERRLDSVYYRLYIPDIFQNEERVLFLDSDIVVDTDISEFIDMDFEGKVAIVCRAVYIQRMLKEGNHPWIKKEYYEDKLKVDCNDYFNAGMILFNNNLLKINSLHKGGGFEFFVKVYDEIRPINMRDQDILNASFARLGGVKNISGKYNYTPDIKVSITDIWKRKILKFLGLYQKEKASFYIKHFCGGGQKPWKDIKKSQNFLFWYYAKFSPFYQQILEENNLKK